MNLNSRHFDRIRTKAVPNQPRAAANAVPCDHVGCVNPGEFRAPMGRDREGQYFCFCLEHVREYNAAYDYFSGMSDDAVAKYQKEALVGHRPTWNMGVNRGAGESVSVQDLHPDSLGIFRARTGAARPDPVRKPRYSPATMKALGALGLDETADASVVKRRYKTLVKRLHPDANGGDRSNEDKLREIIRAYNFLKTIKLSPVVDAAGAAT